MDTVYRIVFALLHSQTILCLVLIKFTKTVWFFFSLRKKREKIHSVLNLLIDNRGEKKMFPCIQEQKFKQDISVDHLLPDPYD